MVCNDWAGGSLQPIVPTWGCSTFNELQVHWQTDRANGERTVQRTMIHLYSEIWNMKDTLVKPSKAYWKYLLWWHPVTWVHWQICLGERELWGLKKWCHGTCFSMMITLLHVQQKIFVAISQVLVLFIATSIRSEFAIQIIIVRMWLKLSLANLDSLGTWVVLGRSTHTLV